MMQLYFWVIVIGLLALLGVVLKRLWGAHLAAQEGAENATQALQSDTPVVPVSIGAQLAGSLYSRFQDLRSNIGGKQPVGTTTQFRTWAASAFASDPEIAAWLAALTDMQISALIEHLTAFCRDMGFELTWLLEGQVDQYPELTQGLAQIVRLYSRASYQAVILQTEVEIFRIYYEYLQNPQSRANREFGEHLFGKLIEQGLSEVSIAEHLAASSRKRQQQIIQTIQRAASHKPQQFTATLKTVLRERTMPVMAAAPAAVNGTAQPAAAAD